MAGSSPRSRGTRGDRPGAAGLGRFIPALAGNTSWRCGPECCRAVHPRARGEHPNTVEVIRRKPGSSPRSRGTRDVPQRRQRAGRFIPALAGNTRSGLRLRAVFAVHPRARGEHIIGSLANGNPNGSSPRSRGTRRGRRCLRKHHRFIPALAGNTPPRPPGPPGPPVHPRARGEHHASPQTMACTGGSSPRSRGTRCDLPARRSGRRFIPALAGNTGPQHHQARRPAVHPRARGEHKAANNDKSRAHGSSPRSRGTLMRPTKSLGLYRFIPALAGNTRTDLLRPAARGGSSPRSRGTQPARRPGAASSRFIPALAGNTQMHMERRNRVPVHPRARGEHMLRRRSDFAVGGSSPRSRGTRTWSTRQGPSGRFIPALAGNT